MLDGFILEGISQTEIAIFMLPVLSCFLWWLVAQVFSHFIFDHKKEQS